MRIFSRRVFSIVLLVAVHAVNTWASPIPMKERSAERPSEIGVPCVHMLDSPPATDAYRKGLAAFYEGKMDVATAAFSEGVKRLPGCALLHTWLSRSLLAQGKTDEAYLEQKKGDDLMNDADDRERRIVHAWSWALNALRSRGQEQKNDEEWMRGILNYALILYPDDADLWALRGDLAESPLRAAPYRLFLAQLCPRHPLASRWTPPVTHAPVLGPPPKGYRAPSISPKAYAQPPRLFDGLGSLHHEITTRNPLAQRYYDQGLRCFDSYVIPVRVANGAAQCFEYAAKLDPHCAMAWWGLSFCQQDEEGAMPTTQAGWVRAQIIARHAYDLATQFGTDKERRFCAARVLELAGTPYRQQFLDALDGAICAYPNDVELWIWRGKVYGDYGAGPEDETPSIAVLAGMPFELAAARMHPEHPAPNHELVHDYEAVDRETLGWKYALAYRASAPNMPHANHMEAHLAMRLGRWDDALSATEGSYRKSQEGFPELDPSHHLYVRLLALAHQGHFHEIEQTTPGAEPDICWPRMLRLMADAPGVQQWAIRHYDKNKPDTIYMAALADLDRGDARAAAPLVATLQDLVKRKRYNEVYNVVEVRARLLIATGHVEEGFNLFQITAAKAVSDAALHAFGQGGYFPEAWGEAALRYGRLEEAALAFSEALAHDHGSIVGALGMQVVCEMRGRTDLARDYAEMAGTLWKNADAGAIERQLDRLRAFAREGRKR